MNEVKITSAFFRKMVKLANPQNLIIFDPKLAEDYLPSLYQKEKMIRFLGKEGLCKRAFMI